MADRVIKRPNEGYDFGAWKEVITLFDKNKLQKYDNLVLVNNSCYGPFRDIASIISEMHRKECDFWGITEFPYSKDGSFIEAECIYRHLQSYFLVFKREMFTHRDFHDFWNKLKANNRFENTIADCEMMLTKTFSDAGFTYLAYVPESADLCEYLRNYSLPYSYPYQMLIAGMPFLKKKYTEYASLDEIIAAKHFVRQTGFEVCTGRVAGT
jgi:lipopolysaccharide biosynthesis protein